MTCIFCAIAAGDVPSTELWQDDRAFAFLDIHPLRRGHALVIPKQHHQHHADLDPSARQSIWEGVARLTPLLQGAVGATAATIAINDGSAAGQEVPHCHVHIVPRKEGDGGPIHDLFPKRPEVDSEELHDLAVRIQSLLQQVTPRGTP